MEHHPDQAIGNRPEIEEPRLPPRWTKETAFRPFPANRQPRTDIAENGSARSICGRNRSHNYPEFRLDSRTDRILRICSLTHHEDCRESTPARHLSSIFPASSGVNVRPRTRSASRWKSASSYSGVILTRGGRFDVPSEYGLLPK